MSYVFSLKKVTYLMLFVIHIVLNSTFCKITFNLFPLESLQYVFDKFGFIVHRHDNLTDTEMMQKLIDAAHNVDHKRLVFL